MLKKRKKQRQRRQGHSIYFDLRREHYFQCDNKWSLSVLLGHHWGSMVVWWLPTSSVGLSYSPSPSSILLRGSASKLWQQVVSWVGLFCCLLCYASTPPQPAAVLFRSTAASFQTTCRNRGEMTAAHKQKALSVCLSNIQDSLIYQSDSKLLVSLFWFIH